jgi:peptidyl-prolyl cis-trans isomerase SurA
MNNMKKHLFSFILVSISFVIMAQNGDPVIMTVNGKKIKKSEFEYIYNKNNNENALDKKSFDEYVELFKNFELKVLEAESQKLDTTEAFRNELSEYRSQLAKTYLTDLEQNEQLLIDEYNQGKSIAEISSLVLFFPPYKENQNVQLLPGDTLETYKKAIQLRNKYLKGEKFEDLVLQYSDDDHGKNSNPPGYVGWFSGLRLLPALGNSINNTPAGQISMPIRMNYGYHLLKLKNKINDPGEVHASHILISLPPDAEKLAVDSALNVLNIIYGKLEKGSSFEDLAKEYSGDKGSAARGGDLSWFGWGAMLPEFNTAVYALEINEISKPVKTQYGYHIIKLLEKRPFPPYEEKKLELKIKLEKTGSLLDLNKPTVEKIKKENNFSANENTYKQLQAEARLSYPTSEAFIEKFQDNQNVLFTLDNQPFKVADFIEFLKSDKQTFHTLSTELLKEKLENYEYNSLLTTEDRLLESKYPDFRNLMQEYRDGTLLFEVSNKEVWEKSSLDTLGLKAFFEENINKYTWDKPHYKGYVVFVKDAASKKKMQKSIKKLNTDAAIQYLLDNYKDGDTSLVKIEKGLFIPGNNPYVDEAIFKTGKATIYPEGFSDFFLIGKLLPNLPESYLDVRGLVITDYQDYLEKEWVAGLNKKYKVIINQDVLNSVNK